MRIGIDWGGTKIEAAAFDDRGAQRWRERIATPRDDYDASIRATVELIERLERETGASGTIGIGIPGVIDRESGLVKNANSTWLNGKPFQADLTAAFGRDVRCANDANCLALSESVDGAAAGKHVVFAAILGTGCGGGIAVDAGVREGIHGVAGEWGHNPLPWQQPSESPGPQCYCGRRGCIETWISGTAFEREYRDATGSALRGAQIVAKSQAGDPDASTTLRQYHDRLARALAHIVNILDPDIIVLGGGMSNSIAYATLEGCVGDCIFGGGTTPIVPALHGDSSGVRGAAWLWPPVAS